MKQSISNLAKHSIIYALSSYFQRFLSFLMMPFYTRTEYIQTLSEFGDYILLYTFIAFVNFLFVLGQDVAYLKFRNTDEDSPQNTLVTTLGNIIFQSILLSIIIVIFKEQIAVAIGISNPQFLLFAIGIIFFDTISNPFYTNLRVEERSIAFSVIKIFRFALELGFNILFVVFLKLGIWGILYANLIAALTNFVILFSLHLKMFPGKYNFALAKKMLLFGLPFVPSGIAFVAIEQSDKILVNYYLSKEQVSIYGASYKFGTILLFLVIAFRNAWQPYFLRLAKTEKNPRVVYAKVNHIFFTLMTLIWVGLALFLGNILTYDWPIIGTILGNPSYWQGISVIPIILLSYVYYALYIGFTPGYYIKNKGIYLALFTFLGFLVNISVNVLLLSHYGYMVAAWATVAAYGTMTLGIVMVNQRFYPLPINWKKIGLLVLIHVLILYISITMLGQVLIKFYIFLGIIALLFLMEKQVFAQIILFLTRQKRGNSYEK